MSLERERVLTKQKMANVLKELQDKFVQDPKISADAEISQANIDVAAKAPAILDAIVEARQQISERVRVSTEPDVAVAPEIAEQVQREEVEEEAQAGINVGPS